MIKSFILFPFVIILLLSSCAYQKMYSFDQKKFYIQEFEINGDTRETFIIQKKIQRFSNKDSANKIKILIDLKKDRAIKEKNIQNKVIKYNLSLIANVEIIDLNTTNKIKRTFSANQSYNVEDSYSTTVNNSKNANNLLIDEIVDGILDQLRIYYS